MLWNVPPCRIHRQYICLQVSGVKKLQCKEDLEFGISARLVTMMMAMMMLMMMMMMMITMMTI